MHQDYQAFYEDEIGYRKLLGYPPVSNLLAIHGSCGNEELLETGMQYIKKFLNRVDNHGHLQIIHLQMKPYRRSPICIEK